MPYWMVLRGAKLSAATVNYVTISTHCVTKQVLQMAQYIQYSVRVHTSHQYHNNHTRPVHT